MSSSPASEGEIVEFSMSAKAIDTVLHFGDKPVNSAARPRNARSRSPRPLVQLDGVSATRLRSRTRSRSPIRDSPASVRSTRYREDDYGYHGRPEGRSDRARPNHGPARDVGPRFQGSHAGSHSSAPTTGRRGEMSGRVAPQHYGQWNQQRGQRRRQNSENQYRNGQGEDGRYHVNSSATSTFRSAYGGRYNSGNQLQNAHGDDGRYHGNSQNTLTSRGEHNGRPHHHGDNIRQTQPQDNSTSRRAISATPPVGSNGIPSKRNEDTNMQEQSQEKSPSPDPPAIDEKAERENRRLRLDAIRAKHMANVQLGASPLLVQALQSNNSSQATSPQAESSIAPRDCSVPDSPSAASPATPLQDTAPMSPAAFNKDEDLVKHNVEPDAETVCAGEPSAADYDPMMDMEDDRMRMAQRQQVNEASTTAHNGTKMQAQEAIVPAASKEQNYKPRPAKDFDMFADDDDDDMFASESGKTGNDDMPKPVGRELDKSLLDNWDDPEGYYRIIIGELFESRYHVQAILGKGTYASVVRATDTKTLLADGKTHKQVAIKIIRNNDMM
ncbi:U4/U6 small nuclear ribonucleoprotein prp4 [Elasticomyces elasticus]|nr:U4/U6 small nuclear ribonucleoprotein prp4 [Elasticomyces elasticus]